MKKRNTIIPIILIITILLLSGIIAEETIDPKNIQKNLQDTSNKILSTDIQVNEIFQIPAKILFGINSDIDIDLQTFIVLIAILIMFILIVHSILELTPFFEGMKSWIGSIIITCLISITGAIKSWTIFFFHLGNLFGILERWSVLKLGFSLIIIFIFFFGSSLLIGIIKEKLIMGKSISEGIKAGVQIAKLKAMSDIEEDLK